MLLSECYNTYWIRWYILFKKLLTTGHESCCNELLETCAMEMKPE